MPPQSPIPNPQSLLPIIAAALAEDIGPGDVTARLLVPESLSAELCFVAREELVACGLEIVPQVFRAVDQGIECAALLKDGERAGPGARMMQVRGPARGILTGERVALNLLQRMSSVASMTAKYVEAVKGTKAVILDTRKTMPGLRPLDKYAVTVGGGQNHRMGLYDMVLIKDNHIGIGDQGLGIGGLVAKARKELASLKPNAQSPIPIVVECDTLAQVEEALAAGPDRIMLDNMSLEEMRSAVALAWGRIPLEASGNVTLATVQGIAQTGVDVISVGRLTHSVPSVDIGLDVAVG